MKDDIAVIDRRTGKPFVEKVYGGHLIKVAYGPGVFGLALRALTAKVSLVSALYGWWQRRPWTRRKVLPFIKAFGIDTSEFAVAPHTFTSFNDFFVRKLKQGARPIAPGPAVAAPGDGRYLAFERVDPAHCFVVKGKTFALDRFLGDKAFAERFGGGSMVVVRLCPSDYHRFHFPLGGTASAARLINGFLYSVNPWAVRAVGDIFCQNKRLVWGIDTHDAGYVAMIAVGATNVGSVTMTYSPGTVSKGQEAGFFSFGASALVLLFEAGRVRLDGDIVQATNDGIETLCLTGQQIGTVTA